jgi:Putative endonuclease segE, GIY-YIG domain
LTWLYQETPFEDPQEFWGFVYIIHDTVNNKKYIGKKQFYFRKTKILKGKKKRILVDSDWKKYFGSNVELNEQVKIHGESNFKREIVKLCKSKSECSYYEAKLQFEADVLLSEEYYNAWISVKVTKKHIKK